MNKIFFIFIIFIFGFNLISSLELTPELIDSFGCPGLLQYGPEIIGIQIPSQVPYKNEIINVYIKNEIFGNIIVEEKIVTNISCSENQEKTYDVYIKDYQTIFDIIENEDNISTLKSKLENKEIQIKRANMGKKLKWFFSKLALNWFN